MLNYYFKDSIESFLQKSTEEIVGVITIANQFDSTRTQSKSWEQQIPILKSALEGHNGTIFFEFSIPRMGSDEQRIRNILEIGGVQGLPRFTVERSDHLENIRMGLTSLERRNYVVLTGMAGCGKSVLAMQALHSKLLLTKVFKVSSSRIQDL